MSGSSGAKISFDGDIVTKQCVNAKHQTDWLIAASNYPLVDGVGIIPVLNAQPDGYSMPYLSGYLATYEYDTSAISRLYEQALLWATVPAITNNTWQTYGERLLQHGELAQSPIVDEAIQVFIQHKPFRQSFCHGDLTLENAFVLPNGDITLFDPNYDPSLYQSFIFDLGKLMQSVYGNYHKEFNSNHGAPLDKHRDYLIQRLIQDKLLEDAKVANISHFVRLRKYRPINERQRVDEILLKLMGDL